MGARCCRTPACARSQGLQAAAALLPTSATRQTPVSVQGRLLHCWRLLFLLLPCPPLANLPLLVAAAALVPPLRCCSCRRPGVARLCRPHQFLGLLLVLQARWGEHTIRGRLALALSARPDMAGCLPATKHIPSAGHPPYSLTRNTATARTNESYAKQRRTKISVCSKAVKLHTGTRTWPPGACLAWCTPSAPSRRRTP